MMELRRDIPGFYQDMNRKERLAASAIASRALRTGKWPEWDRLSFPDGLPSAYEIGWVRDVRTVVRNGLYAVLIREFEVQGMHVWHCAITCALNHEPSWKEKQRIKNTLFDPSALAIEIMPPAAELVDAADVYHMWVLGAPLPFTLYNASTLKPEGDVT